MSVNESKIESARRKHRGAGFHPKSVDFGSNFATLIAHKRSSSRLKEELHYPRLNKNTFASPFLMPKQAENPQTTPEPFTTEVKNATDTEFFSIYQRRNDTEVISPKDKSLAYEKENRCETLGTARHTFNTASGSISNPLRSMSRITYDSQDANRQTEDTIHEIRNYIDQITARHTKVPTHTRVQSLYQTTSKAYGTETKPKKTQGSEKKGHRSNKPSFGDGLLLQDICNFNSTMSKHLQVFSEKMARNQKKLDHHESKALELYLEYSKIVLNENVSATKLKRAIESLDLCLMTVNKLEELNPNGKIVSFNPLTQKISIVCYEKLLALHKLCKIK
eukprot:TRINITY_DN988_c0_g3_i3.p1 TRINITY_DN988_c0_g3~~TRINITY_DN988_c0_g3_i3.p1  ORF type:complete len:335 (+),score=37.11 TRINITY_DN988_c0_g3_i3:1-1005(+)